MNANQDDQSHDQKIVTVYTLRDPYQAELIKNTLQDHGIQCELDDATQSGFVGVFNIGVMVQEKDAQLAQELIEEHHSYHPDDESGENENRTGGGKGGDEEPSSD